MPHKGQRKSDNANKKKSANAGEEKSEIDVLHHPPLKQQFNGPHHCIDSGSTTSSSRLDDLSDSFYVKYKKSTVRFKEALQALVPPRIFESDRVQVLMDAADYVSENGLSVDDGLLQDLKYAIRVRKHIACEKFDGGDIGHSFFISVLCYCWSVLAPLCPRKKKETPIESTRRSRKEEEKSSFHNRFASLAIGDEDQGEDTEDDLPQYSSKPSRPAEERHATELTLQEMMSNNELTDCKLFLLTLDEYMRFNCMQYSKLKEKCEKNTESKGPSSSGIVRDLIQIGVGTNTNIQRVAALEERFNHDYPHLDTPYRFLAKLVFPEYVQCISKIVHRRSSVSSRFQDKYAVLFIGDALECAFRDTHDPINKVLHLVGDFCKHWKIADTSEINQIFHGILLCTRIEAPIEPEKDTNQGLIRFFQGYGITKPSHTWLPYRFIGGKERSIIHTLRLLQHLPNASTPNVIALNKGRLSIRPELFGTAWNETSKRPIPTIPLEMDELLMGDIMPVLLNMTYEGILAICEFPLKQELLSLFCHIKIFINYPDRPVTWTMAFAMHSILSSIFENQGSKYCSYIADTASSAFNQYIKQMKWVKETIIPHAPRRHAKYEENLRSTLLLENLPIIPMHVATVYTDGQVHRALWNPVCAGCILAFVAYQGNVHVGPPMIDSITQFRAWMHIYNALLQTGHISRGELPLLHFFYEKFEKCKATWQGSFPVRGQFVSRWWISLGMGMEEAQKYIASPSPMIFSRAYRFRTQTSIEPQSFVKSYRRICTRDYTDETDKYQTDEQRQDWKRLYNTMVAIEEDEPLLAFNWTSIGYYLNDGYLKLFDHCGWMTELDAFIEIMSDEVRMGRKTIIRNNRTVAKAGDSVSDNIKYQVCSHALARFFASLDNRGTDIMAENVVVFMKNYFLHVPLNKIQWFDSSVWKNDYTEIGENNDSAKHQA